MTKSSAPTSTSGRFALIGDGRERNTARAGLLAGRGRLSRRSGQNGERQEQRSHTIAHL